MAAPQGISGPAANLPNVALHRPGSAAASSVAAAAATRCLGVPAPRPTLQQSAAAPGGSCAHPWHSSGAHRSGKLPDPRSANRYASGTTTSLNRPPGRKIAGDLAVQYGHWPIACSGTGRDSPDPGRRQSCGSAGYRYSRRISSSRPTAASSTMSSTRSKPLSPPK